MHLSMRFMSLPFTEIDRSWMRHCTEKMNLERALNHFFSCVWICSVFVQDLIQFLAISVMGKCINLTGQMHKSQIGMNDKF